MSVPTFLAELVLVLLAVTAILGVTSLLAWRRHRHGDFPTTKVTTHIALQSTSIALWIGFLGALAWFTMAAVCLLATLT